MPNKRTPSRMRLGFGRAKRLKPCLPARAAGWTAGVAGSTRSAGAGAACLLLCWCSARAFGEHRSANSAQSDPKQQHERSSIDEPAGLESVALTPAVGGPGPLFKPLSRHDSGFRFESPLDYDNERKHLFIHGFANGGVCIGDFDGDERPDIYLVGQVGPNKLFRQTANMHFEDVTEQAGVAGGGAWGAGATFVDIDNDGDLDLYVCNYDAPNLLYVNQGDGTFGESAAAYGLDFSGASIMAAFADIDRDGDLDAYLVTNRLYSPVGRPRRPRVLRTAEGLALEPGFEETHAIQTRMIDGERQQFIVLAGQRDHLYRRAPERQVQVLRHGGGVAKPVTASQVRRVRVLAMPQSMSHLSSR